MPNTYFGNAGKLILFDSVCRAGAEGGIRILIWMATQSPKVWDTCHPRALRLLVLCRCKWIFSLSPPPRMTFVLFTFSITLLCCIYVFKCYVEIGLLCSLFFYDGKPASMLMLFTTTAYALCHHCNLLLAVVTTGLEMAFLFWALND